MLCRSPNRRTSRRSPLAVYSAPRSECTMQRAGREVGLEEMLGSDPGVVNREVV
jgi:hypothetical protein